jgi:hypothetical protein
MTLNQTLFLVGYIVLYLGSIAALLGWRRQQRRTRLPFGENLKLLRAPGETQFRIVRRMDEDGVMWLALAAAAPATVGGLLSVGVAHLPAAMQTVGAAIALVTVIACFILAVRWFAEKTRESRDRYLGYFGERLVAEHLEPLKVQGWRIYHDVPATAHGHRFNLDHVAVGPAGIFLVETKTRRKGAARPGFDDHKVYFDGHVLVWPWGEDNHGLDQAERNAAWLTATLAAEIGEQLPVRPVLTLPGWWVENKPSRSSRLCRVANSKALVGLLADGPEVLAASQIERIAARLDFHCRDVEY